MFRLDAETVGIGAVLAALGICCAASLAAAEFGAWIIVIVVGFLAGPGWFAPPLAIVGAVRFGSRRRRGGMATRGPHATGHVR
jgi:hypothetical protein